MISAAVLVALGPQQAPDVAVPLVFFELGAREAVESPPLRRGTLPGPWAPVAGPASAPEGVLMSSQTLGGRCLQSCLRCDEVNASAPVSLGHHEYPVDKQLAPYMWGLA